MGTKTNNYSRLRRVLNTAILRCTGYGEKQHGSGEPFEKQWIVNGQIEFGYGAGLYQIVKKAREIPKISDEDEIDDWLYDIIVYAAATLIAREETFK